MTTDDYYAVHSGGHGDPDGHRDPSLRSGTGSRPHDAGITLVELVVAMVVISVALTGVMLVINYTTLHSADPVLRQQAIAIAEAYMEEITLKNFANPDGGYEGNERKFFDDVYDYTRLPSNEPPRNPDDDPDDDPIEGLEKYSVVVTITKQKMTATGFVPDEDSNDALRIDVTVTDPAGESLTLTGYRADY